MLFSDPIKIAQGQSKAPVGSSETVSSTSKLASSQAIEGVVMLGYAVIVYRVHFDS